jgi:hypothetical protein
MVAAVVSQHISGSRCCVVSTQAGGECLSRLRHSCVPAVGCLLAALEAAGMIKSALADRYGSQCHGTVQCCTCTSIA